MAESQYAFDAIRLQDSRTLIEASAGTGKTFTIQHLVLRLVVEPQHWYGQSRAGPLPMRNLLVITFTRNAAGELRDRIAAVLYRATTLARLACESGLTSATALQAWADAQTGDGDAPILALIQHWIEQPASLDATGQTVPGLLRLVLQRLAQAQADLDLACISTIHTWAHRIVQQKAFASGIRLRQEFSESDAWLEEAAADFLRDCHQRGLEYLLPEKYSLEKATFDLKMALAFDPVKEVLRPSVVDLQEDTIRTELHRIGPAFLQAVDTIRAILDTAAEREVYNTRSDYYSQAVEWLDMAEDLFRYYDGVHAPQLLPILQRVKHVAGYAKYSWITKGKAPELIAQLQALPGIQQLQALHEVCDGWNHWSLVLQRAELLQQNLRSRGLLSFDQLLIQARDALRDSEALRPQVRALFPVAIIDEFQDTDPVQYDIFDLVYPVASVQDGHHQLLLVGDPKQSIYLFRQADVQCYLRARATATNIVELTRNFRTDQPLVDALNLAYERPLLGTTEHSAYTVGLNARQRSTPIDYQPVTAHHGTRLARAEQPVVPLQIATIPLLDQRTAIDDMVAIDTPAVFAQVAPLLAQQIAHLLDPANRYTIDDNPVQASDIAVLVRSHARAALLYRALGQLGIPVVRQTRNNVFHSLEGAEVLWMLRALESPHQMRTVRSALAARGFGITPDQLAQQPMATADLQRHFLEAQSYVAARGVYAALDMLLRQTGYFETLVQAPEGIRAVANTRQIMELLQQAQSEGRTHLAALLQWLHEKRGADDASAAEQELERLENDADAVRIHTIFASKGLEYPIVLCPDLAAGFGNPRYPTKVDLRAMGVAEVADSPVIERYLATNSEDRKIKECVTADYRDDLLRQTYVALTRARHMLWLLWYDSEDPRNRGDSPLAHWLHATRGKDAVAPVDGQSQYGQSRDNATALIQIGPWCNTHMTGRFRGSDALADALDPPPDTLLPRRFADRSSWSFSRLAHSIAADADDTASQDPAEWQQPAPAGIDSQVRLRHFKPGAHTGNFVHDIFEMLDFMPSADSLELVQAQVQASGARFTPVLQDLPHGWDHEAFQRQVAQEVQQVLQVELAPFGFRLADLARSQCFRELEFHLQLRAGASLADLHSVLQSSTASPVPQPGSERVLAGLLKGFIDLLAVHKDKLYIVDYKSNLLPMYDTSSLQHSVYKARYDWQYKLYAVAVRRFCALINRRHGTDYKLGGVAYLYVRGMQPGSTDGIHAVDIGALEAPVLELERFFA